MMKFKITTEQDIREAAAIERRRQNEEERKARIFNAKQRILGVCQSFVMKTFEKDTFDFYAARLSSLGEADCREK